MVSWNLALGALAFAAITSILIGLFKPKTEPKHGVLTSFLLADKNLSIRNIWHLLLSSSFSLNGLLYQIWLGYTIGIWALLIQAVWAISYRLLAKKVSYVTNSNGLHNFLGVHFGNRTKFIAALCSIFGTLLMIGWEFNVGRSTLAGVTGETSSTLTVIFMFVLALVCFAYTSFGGLRSNAVTNTVQNVAKVFIFFALVLSLYYAASNGFSSEAIVPSFSQIVEKMGVWGLITNLAFSAVWQFIDMTTWQSVVGGKDRLTNQEAATSLRWSSWAVFIAPGIIGTAIGAFLTNISTVTQNNVIASALSVSQLSPVFYFFTFLF